MVEDLHGHRIEDPYRWLEDARSPRVRDWTAAQNARTRAVLDALPQRQRFARRLRDLLAVGLLDTPRPVAGKVFHLRREGSQRQAVLYLREGLDGEDRPLVDPNAMDGTGLLTLDWWYPSPDGRFVAYGLSRGGTEMSTLLVREVASGRDTGDAIAHTQRSSVAWVEGGFYYTVHPAPGSVSAGDEHYHRHVRFHRLGDDPARDTSVFGEDRPKEQIPTVSTSPDGRWVVLTAYDGWIRNDVYLLDRSRPDRPAVAAIEGQLALTYAQAAADGLWLLTNLEALRYRIAFAPLEDPGRWTTVVPECPFPIVEAAYTRDRILVHTLEDVTSHLAIHGRDGSLERAVALPGVGAIGGYRDSAGVRADPSGDRAVFEWQSFARPPLAIAVDVRTGAQTEVVSLRPPADLPEIEVTQTSYRSRDATEVPMFLVHRADVVPDGSIPVLLTGYGGFNVSRRPEYSSSAILWAEQGGLFALPSLRGGGERGEAWHRGGMLGRKQNVFDDLHGAAEHLVGSGWTTRERIAIQGGSNGGLLVGAAITQRPDLYGAAACAVPLLDMVRYHHLLIARFWIAEYGSSEDPEQLEWLLAYSPYHNVRSGTRYPPVLLTTAEGDSRVDPMHARKMAALLQSDTQGLVLLRVDSDAGHGVGKPLDKQLADASDWTSFLAWQVGLPAR